MFCSKHIGMYFLLQNRNIFVICFFTFYYKIILLITIPSLYVIFLLNPCQIEKPISIYSVTSEIGLWFFIWLNGHLYYFICKLSFVSCVYFSAGLRIVFFELKRLWIYINISLVIYTLQIFSFNFYLFHSII